MTTLANGLRYRFDDTWPIDGVPTLLAGCTGAMPQVSPIDLGCGIASACISGGEDIAILVENTETG